MGPCQAPPPQLVRDHARRARRRRGCHLGRVALRADRPRPRGRRALAPSTPPCDPQPDARRRRLLRIRENRPRLDCVNTSPLSAEAPPVAIALRTPATSVTPVWIATAAPLRVQPESLVVDDGELATQGQRFDAGVLGIEALADSVAPGGRVPWHLIVRRPSRVRADEQAHRRPGASWSSGSATRPTPRRASRRCSGTRTGQVTTWPPATSAGSYSAPGVAGSCSESSIGRVGLSTVSVSSRRATTPSQTRNSNAIVRPRRGDAVPIPACNSSIALGRCGPARGGSIHARSAGRPSSSGDTDARRAYPRCSAPGAERRPQQR